MIFDRSDDAPQAMQAVRGRTDSREVELKLEFDPAALDDLVGHPLVRDRIEGPVRSETIYYDTPGHGLRKAGISLRVRRTGDRFVQTVKAAPEAAAAGLFDRCEWEEPVPGPEPRLDRVCAQAPMLARPGIREALRPVFTTHIERHTCLLARADARIELVVDRGEVVAGKRRRPIAEVELELLEGTPRALFSLARELQACLPLRLGVMTKAERGARMVEGKADRALKAQPVRLSDRLDARGAFRTIAFACLRHFGVNLPLVMADRNADALHQARVALRRLRSAFTLFRPMTGSAEERRFRSELRTLAGALGRARNLDVLLNRRGEALSADSRKRLLALREEAYDKAIATLGAADMRCMIIDLAEWLAIDGADGGGQAAEPLLPYSEAVLDRFWKRVKRRGRKLRALDEEERHVLRIAGKKLRYAGEFFADLHADGDRAGRRDAFLAALSDLQDALGDLNDLATERQLVRELSALGVELPRLERHRDHRLRDEALSAAEDAVDAMIRIGPYWRQLREPTNDLDLLLVD